VDHFVELFLVNILRRPSVLCTEKIRTVYRKLCVLCSDYTKYPIGLVIGWHLVSYYLFADLWSSPIRRFPDCKRYTCCVLFCVLSMEPGRRWPDYRALREAMILSTTSRSIMAGLCEGSSFNTGSHILRYDDYSFSSDHDSISLVSLDGRTRRSPNPYSEAVSRD